MRLVKIALLVLLVPLAVAGCAAANAGPPCVATSSGGGVRVSIEGCLDGLPLKASSLGSGLGCLHVPAGQ